MLLRRPGPLLGTTGTSLAFGSVFFLEKIGGTAQPEPPNFTSDILPAYRFRSS
jgi:hypothetical protein